MSDLQIWLLVIGAVVVVTVLLFNWVQERRFRKQADAAFQAPMADALMQPGAVPRETHSRVEPALREPVFDAGKVNEVAEVNEHAHLQFDADLPLADSPTTPLEADGSCLTPGVPRFSPARSAGGCSPGALRRTDRIPHSHRQRGCPGECVCRRIQSREEQKARAWSHGYTRMANQKRIQIRGKR